MMASSGFPHANQTAVKQLTSLFINISALGLYIVQLAENIPLFSAHSGLFFSVLLGEAVIQALLWSMLVFY